jgi:hypothetical protein
MRWRSGLLRGTTLALAIAQARIARMERAMEDHTKSIKAVFTVVDRGQGRSFWIRVGTGFTNGDGSLTVRLDAIPVNGTLQIREWEPPYDRAPRPDGTGRATRPAAPGDNATGSRV